MARILLYLLYMTKKPTQTKNRPHKALTDVVGVEVGANLPLGTPVVRIRRSSDGAMELTAAGFLSLLAELPDSAEAGATDDGAWVFPKPYQSSSAAIAVGSELAFLRQASSVEDALSEREKKECRAASSVLGKDDLGLVAGIPEHIGAWAATLLPEGRKPTVCSIQVSQLAWINAFAVSEAFASTNGTALLLLVDRRSTAIVVFHQHAVILYREHSVGSDDVTGALGRDMNLDQATVEKILEDNLIDPTSVIEPMLGPLFRQVELSTDYAHRKNQCFVERFFVAGVFYGSRYWAQVFKDKTGGELVSCNPLDGFKIAHGAKIPDNFDRISHYFVSATGAAVAVLEDA